MALIQEVQGLIPGKTVNPKRGQSSLAAAGNLAMKRGMGAARRCRHGGRSSGGRSAGIPI